jgi:uncharacterized C2H2 Zn-finger protein
MRILYGLLFLFICGCVSYSRENCERWYNHAHPELYGWRKPTPERLKRKPIEFQSVDSSYKSRVEISKEDRQSGSYDSVHKAYKF